MEFFSKLYFKDILYFEIHCFFQEKLVDISFDSLLQIKCSMPPFQFT